MDGFSYIWYKVEYIIMTLLAFIVQNFFINTIRACNFAHFILVYRGVVDSPPFFYAVRAPIIVTILLFLTSLTAFVTGLILPAVQLELKSIMSMLSFHFKLHKPKLRW